MKSGIRDLDVADKQNAHSMTMAVRGVVELFKIVNRENELHRKILAFSVSHDDKNVRIYGHYALIKEREATFYRHPIREFGFPDQDGKDKWTAYKFTKNVYFKFMPDYYKLICSTIDKLPLDAPDQIPPGDSFMSVVSTDIESDLPNSEEIATSAPASQDTGVYKKPRLTANALLRLQVEELKRELVERDERHERHTQQFMEQLERQTPPNARSGNESEALRILQQEPKPPEPAHIFHIGSQAGGTPIARTARRCASRGPASRALRRRRRRSSVALGR